MVVGDPRRPLIGSVTFATLVAALVFSVLTRLVKQIAPPYNHAPAAASPARWPAPGST
jgi:hypothetical protein